MISLRQDHKQHLELLMGQNAQITSDFCKLVNDFLQNGPDKKKYMTASKVLQVETEAVQNCVYGLTNLMLLSCKHKLSDTDFRDSVLTLGFSEEQQDVLSKFYESISKDIARLLNKGLNEPHFDNLEWRFETQVSSRALLNSIVPMFTIQLDLKTKTEERTVKKESVLLEIDPNNLLHVTNELERAFNESRSSHSKKIQRALKN